MATFKYTAHLRDGIQGLALQAQGISSDIQRFFKEELSLKSLGQSAISNLTAKHFNIRVNDPSANSEVKLIEAKWKVPENEVIIFFYCAPTFGGEKVLTPSARPYKGSFYNVVFQFRGAETYLGSLEEYTKLTERKRQAAVLNMMLNCPVKVYSNDPSFYYQGNWEDLEKVDGVVFEFPGPTGKGIWHNKHQASGGLANPNIRITKHMAQIITYLQSFIPAIVKGLKQIGGEVTTATPINEPAPYTPPGGRDVKGRFVKKGAFATGGEEENYGIQESIED